MKMKMKKGLLCLVLVFSFSSILAQEKNTVAHIFEQGEVTSGYGARVFAAMQQKIKKDKRYYSNIYVDNNTSVCRFKETSHPEGKETLSNKICFYKIGIPFERLPQLNLKKDTSGRVTRASFVPKLNVVVQYKMIDIPSSIIEKVGQIDTNERNSSYSNLGTGALQPIVVDHKKYIGSRDPDKMDKRAYNDLLKRIKKDYSKSITRFLEELFKAKMPKAVNGVITRHKDNNQTSFIEVLEFDRATYGKKGNKLLPVNISTAKGLGSSDGLQLNGLFEYGNRALWQPVGEMYVKEIEGGKALMKAYPFNNKKIKKYLATGAPIKFTYGDSYIKKVNRKNFEPVNIALEAKGLFDEYRIEARLAKFGKITLIERSQRYKRYFNMFMNRGKSERFIDSPYQLTEQQEGVAYLLKPSSGTGVKYQLTDVSTSKVVVNSESTSELIGGVMDLMGLEIEVLKIEDQSKKKVKKLIAFSEVEFMQGRKMIISLPKVESFDGKELIRYEEIGECWVLKLQGPNVAELKINKGGKEVKKAMNQKQKLHFKYKEYSKFWNYLLD